MFNLTEEDRAKILADGWPVIPLPLAKYLEAAFPQKCMEWNDNVEQHRHEAGEANLARNMVLAHGEQQKPEEEK